MGFKVLQHSSPSCVFLFSKRLSNRATQRAMEASFKDLAKSAELMLSRRWNNCTPSSAWTRGLVLDNEAPPSQIERTAVFTKRIRIFMFCLVSGVRSQSTQLRSSVSDKHQYFRHCLRQQVSLQWSRAFPLRATGWRDAKRLTGVNRTEPHLNCSTYHQERLSSLRQSRPDWPREQPVLP